MCRQSAQSMPLIYLCMRFAVRQIADFPYCAQIVCSADYIFSSETDGPAYARAVYGGRGGGSSVWMTVSRERGRVSFLYPLEIVFL